MLSGLKKWNFSVGELLVVLVNSLAGLMNYDLHTRSVVLQQEPLVFPPCCIWMRPGSLLWYFGPSSKHSAAFAMFPPDCKFEDWASFSVPTLEETLRGAVVLSFPSWWSVAAASFCRFGVSLGYMEQITLFGDSSFFRNTCDLKLSNFVPFCPRISKYFLQQQVISLLISKSFLDILLDIILDDFKYPLVICYIAIENGHRNSEFSH